jgi:G3E family GTPase
MLTNQFRELNRQAQVIENHKNMVNKQETLEEASENHQKGGYEWQKEKRKSFIEGAKWQQERMYSEEDMKKAIRFGFDKGFCSNSSNKIKNLSLSEQEWFEQFKKK